jgi:hypothetical protein
VCIGIEPDIDAAGPRDSHHQDQILGARRAQYRNAIAWPKSAPGKSPGDAINQRINLPIGAAGALEAQAIRIGVPVCVPGEHLVDAVEFAEGGRSGRVILLKDQSNFD